MTPLEKEERLVERIRRFRSVIVAFSGGVDSSYLAFIADRVLGASSCAVTAISPTVSSHQRQLARSFARDYGLNHREIETREMADDRYTANPVNRCYFCKTELYACLQRLCQDENFEAVLDGSNAEDLSDYRPGLQAALQHSVESPLVEVGLRKADIRALSQKWGLPTHQLPAMPCLSSRFPYGTKVTRQGLAQVEKAEEFLRGLGLKNFRVRHHKQLARIEVDAAEMAHLLDMKKLNSINERLSELGYRFVTLDLQGFRSGSLNPTPNLSPQQVCESG